MGEEVEYLLNIGVLTKTDEGINLTNEDKAVECFDGKVSQAILEGKKNVNDILFQAVKEVIIRYDESLRGEADKYAEVAVRHMALGEKEKLRKQIRWKLSCHEEGLEELARTLMKLIEFRVRMLRTMHQDPNYGAWTYRIPDYIRRVVDTEGLDPAKPFILIDVARGDPLFFLPFLLEECPACHLSLEKMTPEAFCSVQVIHTKCNGRIGEFTHLLRAGRGRPSSEPEGFVQFVEGRLPSPSEALKRLQETSCPKCKEKLEQRDVKLTVNKVVLKCGKCKKRIDIENLLVALRARLKDFKDLLDRRRHTTKEIDEEEENRVKRWLQRKINETLGTETDTPRSLEWFNGYIVGERVWNGLKDRKDYKNVVKNLKSELGGLKPYEDLLVEFVADTPGLETFMGGDEWWELGEDLLDSVIESIVGKEDDDAELKALSENPHFTGSVYNESLKKIFWNMVEGIKSGGPSESEKRKWLEFIKEDQLKIHERRAKEIGSVNWLFEEASQDKDFEQSWGFAYGFLHRIVELIAGTNRV